MSGVDLFKHKSKSWDQKSKRVLNAKAIASVITSNIELNQDMHIVDIGSGTGLLSFFLSEKVGHITGVDNSRSMLEVFRSKQDEFLCKTDLIETDIESLDKNLQFDGVVSSMTIHHVQDIEGLFYNLFDITKSGGFIALADLRSEDGSFHSDNEGVFHFGFDTKVLEKIAYRAGFKDIQIYNAGKIKKPHREFEIFSLIAYKR
jgi:ubiquinone/menaquinone biosynthesis C-methylase UbiE